MAEAYTGISVPKRREQKDAIIVETGEDRRGTDDAEQNQFK